MEYKKTSTQQKVVFIKPDISKDDTQKTDDSIGNANKIEKVVSALISSASIGKSADVSVFNENELTIEEDFEDKVTVPTYKVDERY